jgi:hypothetical protein
VSTLLIIAATLLVISSTARAATYTISSYPAGLADVSCDAFKKNADGSWTQVAILVAGGALIPAGSNFKNTAETRIIEKKSTRNRDWYPVPRPQVKSRSANALASDGFRLNHCRALDL